MRYLLFICCTICFNANAQQTFNARFNGLGKLQLDSGINLTFDEPAALNPKLPTKIILYALPNGNTVAQTFGKKLAQGDDWHFNIQHIGAQTQFIRKADPATNYIVVYVANSLNSWPAWRRKFANSDQKIAEVVKKISFRYADYHPQISLTGHSGGGSFIFGFINSQEMIPKVIERIGFIDATYGYETAIHLGKLYKWLENGKNALQVIAYNDSIVVYNGKPLVSPTGGTWYRSQLMAKDLNQRFALRASTTNDRLTFSVFHNRVKLTLIKNPEAKIFHTVLVEKNGFIDLIFAGTKFQNKSYAFWEASAYENYMLQ